MNPIAQRLAVHATDARRLRAAHSVVNRSQGQEAPRLVGVLRRSGQTAQLIRLKISPKTNCSAHSHPPNQNARVEMNHTAQPANKSHIYRRLVLAVISECRAMVTAYQRHTRPSPPSACGPALSLVWRDLRPPCIWDGLGEC